MRTSAFLFFLCLSAVVGCDKIDTPIPKPTGTPVDTAASDTTDTVAMNTTVRKVLVEEFTGHACAFCPGHTEKLIQSQEDNPNDLVLLSIHAGSTFAYTDEHLPTEFKTPYGTELHDEYKIQLAGYPTSLIARSEVDGILLFTGYDPWKKAIDATMGKVPEVGIGIRSEYSATTDKITGTVEVKALQDLTADYWLNVLLMEDSVIAPQKDQRLAGNDDYPNKINPEYVHRHVLRHRINNSSSLNGERLVSGGAVANDAFEYTFEFTPTSNVVKVENCHIVAFLLKVEGGEIIEVAQAEEAHVASH